MHVVPKNPVRVQISLPKNAPRGVNDYMNRHNSFSQFTLVLAEGKGFEPSTGYPAPDFESNRSIPQRHTAKGVTEKSKVRLHPGLSQVYDCGNDGCY